METSSAMLFSAVLVICTIANASVVICGWVFESKGQTIITSRVDHEIYVIGENQDSDEPASVRPTSGTTTCVRGNVNGSARILDASFVVSGTVNGNVNRRFPILDVVDVWKQAED